MIPDDIQRMLDEGAVLAGSVSGGKDSHAQLTQLSMMGLKPAVRRPGERLALTWFPIFDLSTVQVYELCGHSLAELDTRRLLYKEGQVEAALDGWGMHLAYVFGNNRVSCMLCVLASRNDLEVGAGHGSELLEIYLGWI